MIVRPYGAGRETQLFVLACAVIVISMGFFARVNAQNETGETLTDWQISAFSGLKGPDQAIYNALDTLTIDLWDLYEFERKWPTVQGLAEDYQYPPFAHDVLWKQNGEVQWELNREYTFDGATVYYGHGGRVPGQGAYLFVLTHAHKGTGWANVSIVWRHADPNAPAPATVNIDSLVRNGWKQVVPWRGDGEVRRLRG